MKKEEKVKVGILLYDGVEILDIASPAEVFATAKGFKISSIGLSEKPIKAMGIFTIVPDYSLANCPHLDVLVIPGGEYQPLTDKPELLLWLQAMSIKTNILLSVCSGAFLLAAAGLLDGRAFTTAQHLLDKLQRLVPGGRAIRHKRYVDTGNIITTAGISAGVEGALHVLGRLRGQAAAQQVSAHLEYIHPDERAASEKEPISGIIKNSGLTSNK